MSDGTPAIFGNAGNSTIISGICVPPPYTQYKSLGVDGPQGTPSVKVNSSGQRAPVERAQMENWKSPPCAFRQRD